MATKKLIPAPTCAVTAGTAPLSSKAAAALARTLPHFPLVQAVAEYETAAVHAAQLAGLAESGRMSDLEARSLADAEDVMAAARSVLDKAGRLDLIGGA
ncbi:hypothetical protein KVH30_02125 [Streptomyces olivaceus]|uniref:hypothetical protein n=1 Tax=Streptomyces olivaceus TaxID=47716 RepID=UPI001CCC17B1|nr:hypothetical protein [Streptomyces olivaceus]MBZ6290369.1 hypothetical protein [Streptomyces olivaceus]MBZ6324321.1 hypothetical protein [Streptomyces olivaceus]